MDVFEEEAPPVVVTYSGSAVAMGSRAGNTTMTSDSDAVGELFSSERTNHIVVSGFELSSEDDEIPQAERYYDWSGIGHVILSKCDCGMRACLKKCWGGLNTSRRFLACALKDVNAQCDYVKWLDDEWPERVQADLKEMWRELRILMHNETKFGDRLAEAVEAHVETMDAKASLEKEIAETRERAGRRVEVYKKMVEDNSRDRMKFLNPSLFLGAVIIAILCAIIIMK